MLNINKVICQYIFKTWIEKSKSQRAFAIEHNIEEHMVRKIKKASETNQDYIIPVATLQKICEARNLKISEFFKLINL